MLSIAAALFAATSVVAPAAGNALTLPAARHLVRIDPGDGAPAAWLLAVQQDGEAGHGLVFYRSDDEARTFHYYAPIQNDWSERSTADLVAVDRDVAVVWSYESWELGGSDRHDVWFQWWRYSAGDFRPQPAVRVFDSTSASSAYSRALIARDSRDRLWIQAFRLESDGGSTAVISVSEDGGATWRQQAPLDRLSHRGGGRLIGAGSKLLFFYSSHGCCPEGRLRVRNNGDDVGL